MKKFKVVYYFVHAILNIGLLTVFRDDINITLYSAVPMFIMVLMFIQTCTFRVDFQDSMKGAAYSPSDNVRLTLEEYEKQYEYLRYSFYIFIPFALPFIFFFASYVKLCSLIPYVLGYLVGGVSFRIKCGDTIKERMRAEKEELKKQIQNEELGKK